MQNNEISITIQIEASFGIIITSLLILDYCVHRYIKQYQLELGLLFTNLFESVVTIILFTNIDQNSCLTSLFLVQYLTLSSFLWTILILQKSCLLTRYPINIALEYLKANQFIVIKHKNQFQVLIAYGLPAIATSLIFVDTNNCSMDQLILVSNKMFWTIQTILTIILIGVATYHIVKIYLFSKLIKSYSNLFYSPMILTLTIPWAIYTTFEISLDLSQEIYIIQSFFLLKNSQILISTLLFAYNSNSYLSFVENACTVTRNNYLKKYLIQKNQQDSIHIELGSTTLCTQLLIK